MKLSIVIPAHNEENRIGAMLDAYLPFFAERYKDDVEFIVVVNGSTDSTDKVVATYKDKYPQLKMIVDPKRIGKGGAVIKGFDAASGALIGYVDADGSTPPEAFNDLVERFSTDECDAAIASRWMKGSKVSPKQTIVRQFTSRIFNLCTYILFGMRYADTQCGAKVFRSAPLMRVRPRIGITRWAFDVDLLFQLQRDRAKIEEVPTTWCDVPGSKLAVTEASVEMFLALIRMRLVYSPLHSLVRIYEKTISRPVEFLLHDTLFRHAALLFFASLVTMICNIGFQMVVGRSLSKSDFMMLTSFLAILGMISRPWGSLAIALTHFTSLYAQDDNYRGIGLLLRRWLIRMSLLSLALSFVSVVFARQIALFLHLDRTQPVYVFALVFPVMLVSPVIGGVMRGLQKFAWLALSSIVNGVFRLTITAVLTLCVFSAFGWALLGHISGMYLSAGVLGIVVAPFVFRTKRHPHIKLPSLRSYTLKSMIIGFCASILMTGDVVLVNHYFPDSSDFAYAATLGRMVVFMAVSVSAALFPKVSSTGATSLEHLSIYRRALCYTGALSAFALGICLLIPNILLSVVYGIEEPSRELLLMTRLMGLAMLPAILLGINTNILVSQRRFRDASVVVLCAVLYLLSSFLYHPSPFAIILFAGIANLIALILSFILINFKRPPQIRDSHSHSSPEDSEKNTEDTVS